MRTFASRISNVNGLDVCIGGFPPHAVWTTVELQMDEQQFLKYANIYTRTVGNVDTELIKRRQKYELEISNRELKALEQAREDVDAVPKSLKRKRVSYFRYF